MGDADEEREAGAPAAAKALYFALLLMTVGLRRAFVRVKNRLKPLVPAFVFSSLVFVVYLASFLRRRRMRIFVAVRSLLDRLRRMIVDCAVLLYRARAQSAQTVSDHEEEAGAAAADQGDGSAAETAAVAVPPSNVIVDWHGSEEDVMQLLQDIKECHEKAEAQASGGGLAPTMPDSADHREDAEQQDAQGSEQPKRGNASSKTSASSRGWSTG